MNFTQSDIDSLIDILPTSKSDAKHASELAVELGLPTSGNQVETRQLIRIAIQGGHTIVSTTSDGYWLSSDQTEIQRYVDSLQGRADDTQQRSNEIKDAWNVRNPNNPI